MKFTNTLVLSGAALASALTVAPRDQCTVAKKVILTWVETKEIKHIHKWSDEEVKKCLDDSKHDPSQIYPGLNHSRPYPTNSRGPYPTGTWYGNGTHSGTGGPKPTGTHTGSGPSSTPSIPPPGPGCTNPSVRVEWRNLNDDQRDAYVRAVSCLMQRESGDPSSFPGSRNRYEDFASWHQQLLSYVHKVGAFLPFHRYFLHTFTEVLRDECGYNGPMPWWDETLDAGNFGQAPMFTSRWFGELSNGREGRGVCVTESGWGNFQPNIGPGSAINNPHCLARSLDDSQSRFTSQAEVDQCANMRNYNDYRQCNELRFHAGGHLGVGSLMSDAAASAVDPAFYLHHAFVDWGYWNWQKRAPWDRLFEIGGPAFNGDVTRPSDVLHSFGIRPEVTIADVLDTQGGYLCYVYDRD